MVWDIGTFEVIEGNYWKGSLHVFLNGSKLKGDWLLERDPARGEQAWSLVKVGSAARRVSRERDDASALTGRTMAEIATGADAEWRRDRGSAKGNGEFVEWTDKDHLRHARFLGLRDDKEPREVTRESLAG